MKIQGFSKLTKSEKIQCILTEMNYSKGHSLLDTKFQDDEVQKKFENFSENTIANFHLPLGVVPNFLIDEKTYFVPMVTEESSVVAAASKAAKFWFQFGGFKTQIKSLTKIGHVFFTFDLDNKIIFKIFEDAKELLLNSTREITSNMDQRGGGIQSLQMMRVKDLKNTFKLELKVDTCDAMGANFINSILEKISKTFQEIVKKAHFENHFEVIYSILSNYTPECLVESKLELELSNFEIDGMSSEKFFKKFIKAVEIARCDRDRAVTHNKGIMNGIDALVMATGNDFRATEASIHAYAARDGRYRGLTKASLIDNKFEFSLEVPLALGTVGGLTKLHPLAHMSLDLLKKPNVKELMSIVASLGLAQNFSALRSLITSGIQKGHMKMHLLNILAQFQASEEQIQNAQKYFSNKVVSHSAVRIFLNK